MTEFKLPELGENIEQGDLVRLMIAPGASISEGQPVMELETDKAIVEVPSSLSGTVQEIRVKEGQKVKVGQVIFTVENGAGAKTEKRVESKAPKAEAAAAAQSGPPAKAEKPAPAQPTQNQAPPFSGRRSTDGAARGEFKLPELGENISQGDLVRLMISPGAKVSEGQPVMELETDKAVVEVPSSLNGVVKEVLVKEGEKIKVGQVVFTLEGGAPVQPQGATYAPVEHTSGQQAARLAFQAAIRAEGKTEEQALPPDQPVPQPADFSMPTQLSKVAGVESHEPVPAAPHVRRLARELGVNIHEVKGAGPWRPHQQG